VSRVHKVIVLNKPFKLWDFTIRQLLMMVVAVAISVTLLSRVPQTWKIGNLPANILSAIVFFCLCLPLVKFTDLKPMKWWKNVVLYKLRLESTVYVPKPEEQTAIYPDPTIVEPKKRSDEFYIGSN
jgi:hypothetical protein